ncbi:hypothetical protein RUM44_010992 [Polyplax serrata]|uniref:Unconventional prefoldin RPB5 interactor n=1 Tax=Polyplax serrata TaxID=468196 RepID=A0ABR1AP37_POLSC
MSSANVEVSRWYESLRDQKLQENEKSSAVWMKYKNDLEVTKSLLTELPQKLTHSVMVPIGPKALMPGKIVHSNEFLVNLGETWFVKRTGHQTKEMCDRRIKTCDEMIQKLEKERDLIEKKSTLPVEEEAFGTSDRPEIIEYVTEEENEEWKKQHRIKEREYHKKLAELRSKEKKEIQTEEDLWRHLDELELQEELEDELNRLNAENESNDDSLSETETEVETSNIKSPSPINEINLSTSCKSSETLEDNSYVSESKNNNKKRRVSFACDSNASDDEPLRLEITHTKVECNYTRLKDFVINSPSDIYDNYIKSTTNTHASVLKSKTNPNRAKELEKVQNQLDFSSCEIEPAAENETPVFSGITFKDVRERNPFTVSNFKNQNEPGKKISKFKASRAQAT